MNRYLFLLMLCWGFITLAAVTPGGDDTSSPGTSAATTAYTLVRQENDICVYTRWIPVDDSRSARQVKVTFTIHAPAGYALQVLLDDSRYADWMTGTSKTFRLAGADSLHWHSYIRYSLPWPLRDQDCIIRNTLHKHSVDYCEVILHGEPDFLARTDGVNRIGHMEGSWKLVQVSSQKTLVEYVIFSAQPSSFPKWITDPIIQGNMVRTMTAFREEVDKRTVEARHASPQQADKRIDK